MNQMMRVIIDGKIDIRPIEYIRRDRRPMPKLCDGEIELIPDPRGLSIIMKIPPIENQENADNKLLEERNE